jgi:hypothetical protein
MKIINCPVYKFNSKSELINILKKLKSDGLETVSHKRDWRYYNIAQQIENPEFYLKYFSVVVVEPEGVCYGKLHLKDFVSDGITLRYEIENIF